MAPLRMRNFSRGTNRWSVHLVGKGKLAASIVATKNLMSELAVYRRHLDLSPSPKFKRRDRGVDGAIDLRGLEGRI